MPRRAFPFSFTTTCSRCLHPIGCFKPPESLVGPFISPTWLNSHSFRKSTRRNGFVKFSPPTSPSATLANPFPSAYSTPCSKFFTHNLSPARHRVAVTRVRIVYYFRLHNLILFLIVQLTMDDVSSETCFIFIKIK